MTPVRLEGETAGDYFHVNCGECGESVEFTDLRWEGGLPHVEAVCGGCGRSGDFKLQPTTWMDIIPRDEER